MELYSKPLDRLLFGQNKTLTRKTSQRAMYFKYATIIKTFLAGTTADILRKRLKQAANASEMSLTDFLECHQVNITLALKYSRSLLILVYPLYEISPDLATWNTRLLCLVLRASNCLSVREQDDVIFISKVYRRYFGIRPQPSESGTITKKGHLAKREWIRTCSAVQRMVEVVGDAGLMKEVRNFICKVEMEEKTLNARQEIQFRLESLISEMAEHKLLPKHREENLTDEAKQMVNRQQVGLSLKRNQRITQRPQSAGARMRMCKGDEINCQQKGVSGSQTAYYRSSSQGKRKTTNVNQGFSSDNKVISTESLNAHKTLKVKIDKQNECLKDSNKKKYSVIKRPMSATERRASTATRFGNRPKSASNLITNNSNTVEKDTKCSNNSKNKVFLPNREKYSCTRLGSASGKIPLSVIKLQYRSTPTEIKQNNEKGNILVKNSDMPQTKSRKGTQIKREKSMLSSKGAHPGSGRRSQSTRSMRISRKEIKGNLNRIDQGEVIHVPTAEPDSTEPDDADYSSDRNQSSLKTFKYKEHEQGSKEEHKQTNKKQENSDMRKRLDNHSKNQKEPKFNDKRKVFDDSMKKIANEVLVHQQIQEAAKSALLQDKEFVDEFFTFLNENHVTKKFLRAQSTDPRQSWKQPDGKHVNFSFFLAFVFRHIENKDVKMVSYIVEKMLLRMRCKHCIQRKHRETESKELNSEHVATETRNIQTTTRKSRFSPEHEKRRRTYREISNSINSGHMTFDGRSRISCRLRSVSRERSFTAAKSTKRSRSASEIQARPEIGTDIPKLYRSTSITDNQCWKCIQKNAALTACVNWSNRYLCDLLISEGVSYKDEHLSAAVKANDLVSLVKIVDFLQNNGIWNASSKAAKDALYLTKKHKLQKMTEFLIEKGVEDERIVNNKACSPCFIA